MQGVPVLRCIAWPLVLLLICVATVAGNNVRGILALSVGDGVITGGALSDSQSATLALAVGDTVPESSNVLILAQRARDPVHDVGFEVTLPASATQCPKLQQNPEDKLSFHPPPAAPLLANHPHLVQVGLGDAVDAPSVARALRGKVEDGSLNVALSERGLALQCAWRSR